MGLLFVHDHKFRNIDGKFYSTGGLSDKALIRYTGIFGKTTVIARVIEEKNSNSKYSEIKNKDINIINGLALNHSDLVGIVKDVDSVIVRMPSFLGIKVLKIAKQLNKPYLIELVACPWDSLWNHSIKGKIVAPYMTWVTKKVVKNAEYVLYVTNSFLQNRYPTKGKNVNCSNVVLNEQCEEVLLKRYEKIRQDEKPLIIGTIGALDVKFKGQWRVIKALGKLKKKGNINYFYYLVGGGDSTYLKFIIKKYNVEDQVKIIGSIPHENINSWLDNIDIYVQPSQQEGLPRALIEAMSRGLPCFGAKTGGIPELLEKEFIFKNGLNETKAILEILGNFSVEVMENQAMKNFVEANKYQYSIIEEKRKQFFEEFLVSTRLI